MLILLMEYLGKEAMIVHEQAVNIKLFNLSYYNYL